MISSKGPIDGLDDTTLTKEEEYSINFIEKEGNFYLSLHYSGLNSYITVHSVEIYKFKANGFEINAALFCLGNISKDFSVDNLKILNYVDISIIFQLFMIVLMLIIV